MANRTWQPLSEALSLHDAMNQLLAESFVRPGAMLARTGSYTFPVNIYGAGDELKVEALLPGVSPEDVDLTLEKGVLSITARRHGAEAGEGETKHQWHLQEFGRGEFTRAIVLPFPADANGVTADFTNGVLTVTVPKAAEAKPKRIRVGAGRRQEQLSANTTG